MGVFRGEVGRLVSFSPPHHSNFEINALWYWVRPSPPLFFLYAKFASPWPEKGCLDLCLHIRQSPLNPAVMLMSSYCMPSSSTLLTILLTQDPYWAVHDQVTLLKIFLSLPPALLLTPHPGRTNQPSFIFLWSLTLDLHATFSPGYCGDISVKFYMLLDEGYSFCYIFVGIVNDWLKKRSLMALHLEEG